ncbi:MAG: HemK/PrmC family methyltransferase, partial [Candidatus Omnitrophota bacterium]
MNEAELLFSELLGLNRMGLYQKRTLRLDKARAQEAVSVLKRRISGEPLQYILGKTEFMGLEFKVTPQVLIPRPETELLVEKTIELVTKSQSQCVAKRSLPGGDKVTKILDLGTGSGCIAISLAKFLPEAQIDAVDISEEALMIAKENAKLN